MLGVVAHAGNGNNQHVGRLGWGIAGLEDHRTLSLRRNQKRNAAGRLSRRMIPAAIDPAQGKWFHYQQVNLFFCP